ncbi:MAG: hypothetical protein KF696_08685 [Planctomycetes bacterium]|nr:hypothetical protein [Planctomycetota bacterium]MCW8136673.1 hypothetical protein [Planctomycetota bacterium]
MKRIFLMQLSDGSEINPVSKRRVMEVMSKLHPDAFQSGDNYMILREKTGTRASLEWTHFNGHGFYMILRRGVDAHSPMTARPIASRSSTAWIRCRYRHDTLNISPEVMLTGEEMLRVLRHFLERAARSTVMNWVDIKDSRAEAE